MHDEDRLACGQQRKPSAARARSGRQNFRRRAAGCWRAISRIRDRPGRVRVRVRCDAVRSRRQSPVRERRPVRPQRGPVSRPSPACGAPGCTPQCASRQSCLERGKGCGIAEIGRRVGSVNHPARAVDRRVADQPEICFGRSWLRQPCGEQDEDRGLGHLLGAAEHVAGLAADLPQRQPRDGEPAQARQHRRKQRVAP